MAKSFGLNTISNITNKMTFDTFNKKVEKATCSLKATPDWNAIIEICDAVRHKDVTPKYALSVIKKKLYSRNPHQIFFTLLTLESLVKNCGQAIHEEVATVAFCELLNERLQNTQDQQIRHKILDMLQTWAYAFRDMPQYRPVHDIVLYLKKTGYRFPPLNVSDAMFATHVAPKFVDGDVCYKCNIAFSLLNRRHHCRGCGQAFCQACSTSTSILPRYGIEKPVRVCDICFKNHGQPSLARNTQNKTKTNESTDFVFKDQDKPKTKTADELQEEEELQLAIALSKSEAEHKEKQRRTPIVFTPSIKASAIPVSSSRTPAKKPKAENPEMSHYLNRDYWEKRAASSKASASAPSTTSTQPSTSITTPSKDAAKHTNQKSSDDPEDKEIDEFVETLQTQIEIFVNRMKSDASRGRPIVNDTAVQSLFLNLTAMHTHLIAHIRQLDDKRTYLEGLQNKIIEVREYRTALDLLRAEHAAQVATAQEVAEIKRQMELAVKLDALRKSKQNYLQYQRHIAFQRVQEEEREFQQGRIEMQKVPYMRSAHSGMYSRYPTGSVHSNSQFLSNPQAQHDGSVPSPNNMANNNSLRIIPQNLLSQTRVHTLSINQVKNKQMTANQQRMTLPQNMSNVGPNLNQDLQDQRQMQYNRENQPSQQIPPMYQNINNYKPSLSQQPNYTNLVPQNQQPVQDQNMGQFQKLPLQNDGQLYAPNYAMPQQMTNQTQKHQLPNIQMNQAIQGQNINPNNQYYAQNNQQYYTTNNQTTPTSMGQLQSNQQNQNTVQTGLNICGPQANQGQNLPQNMMAPIQNQARNMMQPPQNQMNQILIPNSQTLQAPQNQPNPNLMQPAQGQTQNLIQAQSNVPNVQNQTPNLQTIPLKQSNAMSNLQNPPPNLSQVSTNQQQQGFMQNQNLQSQNPQMQNLQNQQNMISGAQNVVSTSNLQSQNQNVYKPQQIPQQNTAQTPQSHQSQNYMTGQTVQAPDMVPGQKIVNGTTPGLLQPNPGTNPGQPIQFQGQTRVQININGEYQEQTDKQVEGRNFESQNN